MQPRETAYLIALIQGAKPRWKPEKETSAVYHMLLKDLDDPYIAKEAVLDCLKASEWEPSPAAIREAYTIIRDRKERERREQQKRIEPPVVSESVAAKNRAYIRGIVNEFAEKHDIEYRVSR